MNSRQWMIFYGSVRSIVNQFRGNTVTITGFQTIYRLTECMFEIIPIHFFGMWWGTYMQTEPNSELIWLWLILCMKFSKVSSIFIFIKLLSSLFINMFAYFSYYLFQAVSLSSFLYKWQFAWVNSRLIYCWWRKKWKHLNKHLKLKWYRSMKTIDY